MSFYHLDLFIYILLGFLILAIGLVYSVLARRKVIKALRKNAKINEGLKTSNSPLKSKILNFAFVVSLIAVGCLLYTSDAADD